MTSPASASTARRLNATTTVPGVSERSVRAPTNSSGSLRSKTFSSCSGKRALHERERVERAEQEDLAVLAGEQEPRPGRAALRVVGPLHLVEDEQLARERRHLHRRADDGRVLVDALLAGDQTDVLGADPLAEAAVRLLREHPERACVDAGPLLRELAQRRVRLAGVRRPEVRDDALGLDAARRKRDRDAALCLAHGLGRAPAAPALGAARPLLPAACRTAVAHLLRLGGSGEPSNPRSDPIGAK